MREGEGEESSMTARSSLSNFFRILSSYNSNVLLAALVFLLLVVLFVLLLHFYARFYWSNSEHEFFAAQRHRRRRRNRRRTVTTTRIIPSVPLRGIDGEVSAAAPISDDKGLDSSVISSIPLFVYEDDEKDEDEEEEEECVICLGLWEAGDFGRKLRNCGHGFHVECIDMWLSSHSTCPLCRSPVLTAVSDQENVKPAINDDVDGVEEEEEEEAEVRLQMFPTGEDENVVAGDQRLSLPFSVMEDDLKTGVDDGEVRIEVLDDEEINGGGSRTERRSTSSSASSSLKRMLSSRSRSECNKVFPSATQDSSE